MAAIEITKENYEAEVLQSDKPVLLDFGHPGVDHARWYLR